MVNVHKMQGLFRNYTVYINKTVVKQSSVFRKFAILPADSVKNVFKNEKTMYRSPEAPKFSGSRARKLLLRTLDREPENL